MKRTQFLTSLSGLGVLALLPKSSFANNLAKPINKLKAKVVKSHEGDILNVIGDIQTHKLVGSDTDNQIVEWEDNVEPGTGIPPHIHTKEDEIFRVIKGHVEFIIDGKTIVLEAGDTAFAPKNIPHSWKVVGTEKAKMITSAFPSGIELMFRELASLPPGPPDFEKVTKICGRYGISFG